MADLSRSAAATAARAIAFVLTASLVVACGTAATSSPTAPAATLAVTPTGTPSAALPSLDLSSFQADVALEALLPDSLGGTTLTKLSISGVQLLAAGSASTKDLQTLLTALGKTAADVTAAIASDRDMTLMA